MRKCILFIIVISLCFIHFECRNKPQPVPQNNDNDSTKLSSDTIKNYLVHWCGNGSRITPQFMIHTSPWRIEWSFQPKTQIITGLHANMFNIVVHSSYQDFYRELAANLTNTNGFKNGSADIKETGQFYLEIKSMQGIWDIKIFENTQ